MRAGVVAKKVGMSRIYDDNGVFTPVTLLQVEDNVVISHKTKDKHGYEAVQLSTGDVKEKHLSKPVVEMYKKLGFTPKKTIKEFRVESDDLLEVGTSLGVNHFNVGDFIDVSGKTIGKGFAGVIKRWNFRSLRATHGVSLTHRSHGSTGGRQDPGKVFKGKKMAGRLGNERVTTQNLKIVAIDEARKLLIVKGAVPGHKGSLVEVRDAVKKTKIAK